MIKQSIFFMRLKIIGGRCGSGSRVGSDGFINLRRRDDLSQGPVPLEIGISDQDGVELGLGHVALGAEHEEAEAHGDGRVPQVLVVLADAHDGHAVEAAEGHQLAHPLGPDPVGRPEEGQEGAEHGQEGHPEEGIVAIVHEDLGHQAGKGHFTYEEREAPVAREKNYKI